ncbi:GTPase ObgE [Candidatus Pseudoscillospira sp. SGI.172]|uniref:GTPase ObgE n=1 Tax=Candidatus Pseudoscillospira sp. SGI.172 TaxID=3420582 RepID=UPI0009BC5286|nr:GTPase ObgE [Pseudoflavonifractor sp.]MDY3018552.1 GTPase ObgE [Oscillospiraceae bacterium]
MASNGFIDKARITVRAGTGGGGAVAFHREKYVAAGGPDGGDGGRGGNIILRVDEHMSTLMDFRYKRKYTAENGMPGQTKRCSGKDGGDLFIRVPRGTVVRDTATGEIICDMAGLDTFVLARGGKGGWGNQHFATPTRQVPHFAKAGLPGQERDVTLELKLLADVGLVGFPNVGKSTLLSVVTRAQPKIANYHFTTLFPNLGVVALEEGVSFVLADIPGIIEGAAEGAGLGHDFLRHIDRCRLLIHVVDVSGSEGRDPVADFEAINAELAEYSPELAKRPMLVAGNKVDITEDRTGLEALKAHVEALGLPFFELSAAAHQGTRELMYAAAERLRDLPPITVYEPTYVERPPEVDLSAPPTIEVVDGTWVVDGPWLRQLMANVNFNDYESKSWFDRQLRASGLFARMEEMGIQDGDIVCLYNLEFEYQR